MRFINIFTPTDNYTFVDYHVGRNANIIERCPQSRPKFPTRPTASKHFFVKRLRVRDRVMTSHDVCTSWISRVLTVASLQRLKLEVLIPPPADCEVQDAIKF